jgi:ABC-type phosphate transport system substrate-binding protein
MTRMLRLVLAVATLIITHAAVAGAAEPAFRIVVNSASSVTSLTKQQTSDFFLKKATKWPDGTLVVPVDLPATSPVREAFSKAVHGRSAAAVASYWQQQFFSGRETPPAEKATDAAVLAFVKENANSIGYVSGDAAVSGVKVVAVQ